MSLQCAFSSMSAVFSMMAVSSMTIASCVCVFRTHTPLYNYSTLHPLELPNLLFIPLCISLHLHSSKHTNMPRTAGTEFDIFEDESPPRDVKDIIIAAHDRAIAREDDAFGKALWACYERAQVDATVGNLLWAILLERTTPQDRAMFRVRFLAPAQVVVARQRSTVLVESNQSVANGQSLVCYIFHRGC